MGAGRVGPDDLRRYQVYLLEERKLAVGTVVAEIADRNGNLYVSADTGRSWSRQAYGFPSPSSVLIA